LGIPVNRYTKNAMCALKVTNTLASSPKGGIQNSHSFLTLLIVNRQVERSRHFVK
jgi:hypothetical protein